MRILSGFYKGREIQAPKTRGTRPITSLLRKSIFDTLQFQIEGRRVLDLFAGSGAIGLEAMSRGAKEVVFVESGREAIEAIKNNIKNFALEGEAKLFPIDAFLFLKRYKGEPFDILFIDPPYPFGVPGYKKIIEALLASPVLKEGARIFLEAPGQLKKEIRESLPSSWTILKEKSSSTTHLFDLLG